MTRFSWLRMTRGSIVWQSGSRGERTHYLERRIVFCADCESPRALTFGSGALACSSCGSGNWMHPPSNLTTRVHEYRDSEPEATTPTERSVGRPKAEVFVPAEVALV